MKVPDDMCVEVDNDALVKNCDNDDHAVIADSLIINNNNQANNDKTITDNKIYTNRQINEDMKNR